MVRARPRLPGEPSKGIVTLAGQMGVADATATKPPRPRPPPPYTKNDNSEPSARANQPTGTAAHTGSSCAARHPAKLLTWVSAAADRAASGRREVLLAPHQQLPRCRTVRLA